MFTFTTMEPVLTIVQIIIRIARSGPAGPEVKLFPGCSAVSSGRISVRYAASTGTGFVGGLAISSGTAQ